MKIRPPLHDPAERFATRVLSSGFSSIVTRLGSASIGLLSFVVTPAHADTFGSGANTFTINFVNIGNPGNGDDLGAGGGLYSAPHGRVAYRYRMGATEVAQDWITKATALGMTNVTAGSWGANQPAGNMTWYEAAAFVNFLNTSTGHQAAYNLSFNATAGTWSMSLWPAAFSFDPEPGVAIFLNQFRHKNAYYFLPSLDEWYKAAYHKNDGATANYWDYATGSNSIPDGLDFSGDPSFNAVFAEYLLPTQPNAVTNVGVASPYGTFGQGGNLREWSEGNFDELNTSPTADRWSGGGLFNSGENFMRSTDANRFAPGNGNITLGFRVASVPEPSAALFAVAGTFIWIAQRRPERSHRRPRP